LQKQIGVLFDAAGLPDAYGPFEPERNVTRSHPMPRNTAAKPKYSKARIPFTQIKVQPIEEVTNYDEDYTNKNNPHWHLCRSFDLNSGRCWSFICKSDPLTINCQFN
jgi:hypothetical protein